MKRASSNKSLDSSFFYYDDDWSSSADGESNRSESDEDSDECAELANNSLINTEIAQNIEEQNNSGIISNMDIIWDKEPTFREAFEFTGNPGVKIEVEDKNDPLNIFERFVTFELLQLISIETNLYASQLIGAENRRKPHSRSKYWVETTPSEIMDFIGFILLQGIVLLPNYSMYFSRRRIISCGIFSEIFTERRFHLLIKYLHFHNNESYEGYIGPK